MRHYIVPKVLLRWLMAWRSWGCVQCLVLLHCLVVMMVLLDRNKVLWAHSSSLRRCVLTIPCRLRDKRARRHPAWPNNWGVEGFAASCLWSVWMIVMQQWHWLVLSTTLPRNKNLPHTCWMNHLALSSNRCAFDSCVAYYFLVPYWIGKLGYGACCSLPAVC